MNTQLILALAAAGAGCCIALQATANARFRQNLDSQWYASFFSICGTIATASLFLLLVRQPVPSAQAFRQTEWWNWIGGPMGALIVLAGATLTRDLGAAAFIALVVGGQLICSVLLDHFAMMGLKEQPITLGRVVGVLLVIGGVICIKYL